MADRAQITAWMAAAADGDRAVLEPLFGALWSVSARYAERLVGSERAEDCVQDALVQLFAQLDRFDRTRDGLTWALTLVTWSCRTARKSRGREAARTGTPVADPAIDGLAIAVERDLIRAALATLGSLDSADIETISAMIGEADHGLPPPTFRKRVERSLARLRNAWRARHGSI